MLHRGKLLAPERTAPGTRRRRGARRWHTHPVRRIAGRLLGATAALTFVTGGLALGQAPIGTQEAVSFLGVPSTGALFSPHGTHFCTASVVDSPGGDLLITAAHCVSGRGAGLVFEPGYHDGIAPYGRWAVTAAYGSPAWLEGESPQRDVAFLAVARKWWHGRLRTVQAVVGGNRLVTAVTAGRKVTVVAYNDDDSPSVPDEPVVCTARVGFTSGYPTFVCDQYLDGSSGSPWVARTSGGQPVVVGVIGGLHQGGCLSWTSYSADFGPATVALYDQAVAGRRPSVFPAPGSDGCTTGL